MLIPRISPLISDIDKSINRKVVANIEFRIERGTGADITFQPRGIDDLIIGGTDASFNNTNGVLRLDGNYGFTSNQETITDAWGFYFKNLFIDTSSGTWRRLINCKNQTSNIVITRDDENGITISTPTGTSDRYYLDPSSIPNDQEFNIYVDIKNTKAYVDGSEISSTFNSGSLTHRDDTQLFCRKTSGGGGEESKFVGTCEQVIIFNDLMTEKEIKYLTSNRI